MEESILKSVKKVLGIDADYIAFDLDILIHINTAFAVLNQLGIGPEAGFMIEDDTAVWATFYGTDSRYNAIRTYVYLKVRIMFDPPQTAYLVEALNSQIKELEWRINAYREETQWVDPNLVEPELEDNLVLDGGSP
jgi:hypothetical protein